MNTHGMKTQPIFFVACIAILSALGSPAWAMSLTDQQQVQVLAEAQQAMNKAMRLEATQPAAAKPYYAQAAEKFQLLAETTNCDGELYRRLADAQLHSGLVGKAIANYQRAEQLLGPDPRVSVGLMQARALRDQDNHPPVLPTMTLMEKLSLWNRSLSLPGRFWGALAVWIGLWGALIASLLVWRRAFRASAVVLGLAFILLAGSLTWDLFPDWNRTCGVVTTPTAVVRQGNGETFPAQCAPVKDGTEFDLIERRGKWLRVSLPDGNTGWLDAAQVELLPPRRTVWS